MKNLSKRLECFFINLILRGADFSDPNKIESKLSFLFALVLNQSKILFKNFSYEYQYRGN